MQQQNDLLVPWARPETMRLPADEFAASVTQLFLRTLAVTEQIPAGVWVTRALRAVPSLQDVRNRSHDFVTDLLVQPFLIAFPKADADEARLTFRLSIDAQYAALELLFDDPRLDALAVARITSSMVTGQLMTLRKTG